jgi:mannosyltransferase OCH1-like enzyme
VIPKKIHYCWFGKNPLPESVQKCIASWKKYCPNYEIIEWNEDNYDIHKIPFISDAYKYQKYAFVSDYARLDIIYNEGGIYLDTDVELLRPIDSLLEEKCFMGFEIPGKVNTGIGFGAIKQHEFIKENKLVYESMEFNPKFLNTCVEITTNLFESYGLINKDIEQKLADVTIYPTDYFCPFSIETRRTTITNNTYSIHHYDATWYGKGKVAKIKKFMLPFKIKARLYINKSLGEGTYERIKQRLKK